MQCLLRKHEEIVLSILISQVLQLLVFMGLMRESCRLIFVYVKVSVSVKSEQQTNFARGIDIESPII